MNEKTVVDAVLRYFRRYYCEYGCMWHVEPVSYRERRPDLLFVQTRRNLLYIVEAEPTLSRAFGKSHGFAQLRKYKGNYKWLAIPNDKWEKDEDRELELECDRTGIGLLTVSGIERFHVEERKQPEYIRGDFLRCYPLAEEEWETG